VSDYLTVAEVAARLRLTPMSVYRLIHSGALPAYRFGNSFRIDPADLDTYLESARAPKPTPTPPPKPSKQQEPSR
jgi:excisionase family DNA binding protein